MTGEIRLIKKYPNRRLYDTRTSTYITLAEVRAMVLERELFKVLDAKTGDDLTRSILLQIILDAELLDGMPMFSSVMLSQIIRFYGHSMQGMMCQYLEKNVQSFCDIQQRLQDQAKNLYGDTPKVGEGVPEVWPEFMNFQAPAFQSLMSAYLDQSQRVFLQFQEQLQAQTQGIFSNLYKIPPDKKTND